MSDGDRIVVSASRRTDIPAFYMAWFMAGIERGFFEVRNPYNRRVARVPAGVEAVHTIVFWSKNFGPFIAGGYGEELRGRGYNLFFNFTLNSRAPALEPRLPPLRARLSQMAHLASRYDPRSINWRFDPICFYRDAAGRAGDNLGDFERIAESVGQAGVRHCITSFMDPYAKVRRRAAARGITFVDPPVARKAGVLTRMERLLAQGGMRLQTCCEKDVLTALPPDSGVTFSRCIPSERLQALFGGRLSLRCDPGQRRQAGCGCRVSVDIGSYDRHPCPHGCLFCYANPALPAGEATAAKGEKG